MWSSHSSKPRWRFWISRERLIPTVDSSNKLKIADVVSGDDDEEEELEKMRMITTLLIL